MDLYVFSFTSLVQGSRFKVQGSRFKVQGSSKSIIVPGAF
jgi:hypothetical protein